MADGEILIIQYVLKPHLRPAKWRRTLWLNMSLNLNRRMCLLKWAGVLCSARCSSGRRNIINTPGSHNNLLARLNEIRQRGFQLCGRQPDKCMIQKLRLRISSHLWEGRGMEGNSNISFNLRSYRSSNEEEPGVMISPGRLLFVYDLFEFVSPAPHIYLILFWHESCFFSS